MIRSAGRLFFALALAGFVFGTAAAQTTVTFDTRYQADNVNMWSGSAPTVINYNRFVGVEWNESTGTYGGITHGLFGEPWGLEFSAATSGKIGFDVMFKSTSGTLNIDLPNTVSFDVPDLSGSSLGTITVSQARNYAPGANAITSAFPQAQFSVDAYLKVAASVTAHVGYGFGEATGTLTLSDLTKVAGVLTYNPALLLIDPFDLKIPLVEYNVNNSGKIALLGGLGGIAQKNLDAGFTFPINSNTFTPVNFSGKTTPTAVEVGSITYKNYHLDAASGSSLTSVEQQDDILAIRANLLGLTTLAYGLPINPFEPKIYIPGTPLLVNATILDVSAGIDLGLKQTLTLKPQTRAVLQSNMDITYNVNGQLYTTSALDVLLPDDGSPLNISIVSKPDDPNLQIYPSTYVSPVILNTVELGIAPSLRVTALSLGISAYGLGGGLGPVYDNEFHPDPFFITLLNSTVNLGGLEQFTKRYRTLDSIVNPGLALGEDLDIQVNEFVQLLNRTQVFKTSSIPAGGTLIMRNSGFNNTTSLSLATGATLNLNGGGNVMNTRGLDVASGAKVVIDGGSVLNVTGKLDANGDPIDGPGTSTPGFVDSNGTLGGGNFVIGGQLYYNGEDIRTIASGVTLALVDNSLVGDGTLHLINGSHNPLTALRTLSGSLMLAGPSFALAQSLTITSGGVLDLAAGSVLAAPGLTVTGSGTAAGSVLLDHGTRLDLQSGAFGSFGNIDGAGVLSDIQLYLGDTTGGAQIRYNGNSIAQNDANVVLSGAAPSGGYLARLTGANSYTEGLQTLTLNTGTLSLISGAQLTLTGALQNDEIVMISGAGSKLVAPAGFNNTSGGLFTVSGGSLEAGTFTNNGGFELANGGTVILDTITNLTTPSDGVANTLGGGGVWTIGGGIDAGGLAINGLASGTTLILRTPAASIGSGFTGNAAFEHFSRNDGDLIVREGATLVSDAALTNSSGARLTVSGTSTGGAASTVTVRGIASQAGTVNVGTSGILDTTGGDAQLASYWPGQPSTASSLPLDGIYRLTGGTWTIGGQVVYTGHEVNGIAPGATLVFKPAVDSPTLTATTYDTNSAGGFFVRKTSGGSPVSSPGLTALGTIAGTLTLEGGTALRTDSSLTLASTGTLNIDAGATLHVRGSTFGIASGGSFNLAGNMVVGGGVNTATFQVPSNYTFTTTGEVQLGRVTSTTGTGGRFFTVGSGNLAPAVAHGTWTNQSALIRGVGTVSGDSLVNQGAIYAADGTLVIDATNDQLINSGRIGSLALGASTSSLNISHATITNSQTIGGNVVQGLLDYQSNGLLSESTVNGGNIFIGPLGTLSIVLSTLNANSITTYGTLAVSLGTNYVNGDFEITRSGQLTLAGGTTLVTQSGKTLLNRGTINIAGGATSGASFVNDGFLNVTASSLIGSLQNLERGNINIFNGTAQNLMYSFTGAATFTNKGYVHLSPENPALTPNSSSSLVLWENTTFTGGGAIQLGGHNLSNFTPTGTNYDALEINWTNSGSGTITALGPGYTLTNSAHTIQGAGNIGAGLLTIVNDVGGVIHAMGSGRTLTIEPDAGGFTNRGWLDVDSGATLVITSGFNGFSGNTVTEGNYRVAGTLRVPTVGSFDSAVTFLFDGPNAKIEDNVGNRVNILNNLADGTLIIGSGFDYTVATGGATSFNNAGLLVVRNGSVFTVTGSNFTNYASHTLNGGSWQVLGGTLKFDNADLWTNTASLTLGGLNPQIVNQGGANALANFASNAAGATLTIQGIEGVRDPGVPTIPTNYTLPTTAAEFTNNGTLNVTSGSRFVLGAGLDKFTNNGAVSLSGSSTFTVNADLAIENTGPLSIAGGSTFNANAPAFTNNQPITLAGGAALVVNANTAANSGAITTTTGGTLAINATTFTNSGALSLGGNATFTMQTFNNTAPITIGPNAAVALATGVTAFNNSGLITIGAGSTFTTPTSLGTFTGRSPANAVNTIRVADTGTLHFQTPNVTGLTGTGTSPSLGGKYEIVGTLKLPGTLTNLGADLTFYGPNAKVVNASNANALALATITPSGILTLGGETATSIPLATNNGDVFIGGTAVADGIGGTHDTGGALAITTDSLAGTGSITLHSTGDLAATLTLSRATTGTFTLDSRVQGDGQINPGGSTTGLTVGASGVLAANSGVLSVNMPLASAGRIEVAAGSTLNLNDTPSFAGTVDVAGRMNLNSVLPPTIPAAATINVHGADAKIATLYTGDYFNVVTKNYGSVTFTDSATSFLGTYGQFSNFGTFAITDNATIWSSGIVNYGTLLLESGGNLAAAFIVNDGTIRVNGYITPSVHGTGEIRVFGTGDQNNPSFFFGAGSTYTGRTIIENGGVLQVAADSQLGVVPNSPPADQLRIESGGTLQLQHANLAFGRNVVYQDNATITGAGTINGVVSGTGTLVIGGSDFAPISARISSGGSIFVNGYLNLLSSSAISGDITGFSNSVLGVTDTLVTLTGSYSYPGIVSLGTGGALLIGNGGATGSFANASFILANRSTLVFDRTGAVTLGTGISGDAGINEFLTGGLYLRGGVQATTGANNNYTGRTIIEAGSSLTLTGGSFGGISNSGSFIFAPPADTTSTAGGLSGSGSVLVTGAGTSVFVTGPSFDVSSITINSGSTLQIGNGTADAGAFLNPAVVNNGTLVFNAPGNISTFGVISGPGGVIQRGSGILTLHPDNTYTGSTTIKSGTVYVNEDSALGAVPATFDADNIILDGGALGSVTLAPTRGITVASGGGSLSGTDFTPSAPLGGAGPVRVVGGTVNLKLAANDSHSYAANNAWLTLSNRDQDSTVTGALNTNEFGSVTVTGIGVTTFTALSENEGFTTISPGTTLDYRVDNTGSLVNNGLLRTSGGSKLGTLYGDGSLVVNPSGGQSVTGHTLRLGDRSVIGGELVTLSIGHVTINSGASLVFDSTYEITGTTTLEDSSTLRVDSGSTVGLTANGLSGLSTGVGNGFNISGPITGAGSVSFNGGTLGFGNVGTTGVNFLIGSHSGGNGGAPSTLLTGNTEPVVLGGNYGGLDALLKVNGTGLLTLTGGAHFDGGTTIAPLSKLQIGNGGATGTLSGPVDIGPSAFLVINRSDDVHLQTGGGGFPVGVIDGAISGFGGLEQAGSGNLVIAAPQAYTGPTKISAGTLTIADGGSLARDVAADPDNGITAVSVGDIVNNSRLVINRAGTLVLDNDITGTGTLVQNSLAGILRLEGALSYTGATTISEGAIQIVKPFANAGGITIGMHGALELGGSADIQGTIANSGTITVNRTADDLDFLSQPLGYYTLGFTTTGGGLVNKIDSRTAILANPGQANTFGIAAGSLGITIASGTVTSGISVSSGIDPVTGTTPASPGTFFKEGSGTLVLTASSFGFGGSVEVRGGTLQFGNGGTAGVIDAPVSLADDGTLAFNLSTVAGFTHVISGEGALHVIAGTLGLTKTNTYTGGTTIDSGAALQISGLEGGLAGNVVNNGTLLFERAPDSDYTFGGNTTGTGLIEIAGGGAGGITLTGTHANAVTIDANASLSVGYAATMNGAVTNNGNLTLLTSSAGTRFLSLALPGGLGGSGTVTIGGGGRLLVIDSIPWSGNTWLEDGSTFALSNDSDTVFTRSFFGAGNFEKTGAGKLSLDHTSVVNGDIIVSQGTLEFTSDGSMSSLGGSYDVRAGGTLALNSSILSPVTFATPLKGSGNVHQMGGPITLAAESPSFLGTFTVDTGKTLNFGTTAGGQSASIGLGTLVLNGTANLDYNGAVTLDNGLAGASTGKLLKSTTGALTLNGLLDFAGEINSSGPVVTAAQDGSAVAKITASAFTNSGSLSAGIIDSPSITNTYPSSLTITGTNSSLSQVITNRGTLTVGNGGTSGSLAGDIDNAGGVLAYDRSDTFSVGDISSVTGGELKQVGSGILKVYSDATEFIGSHKVEVASFTVEHGTMEFMSRYATGSITAHSGTSLILHGDETGSAPAFAQYDHYIASNGAITTIGNVNLTNVANTYAGPLEIGSGAVTLAGSLNPLTGADVTIGSLAGTGTLSYSTGPGIELGPYFATTISKLTIAGDSTHTGTIALGGADLFVGGNLASNVAITTVQRYDQSTGQNVTGGSLTFTNANAATFSGTLSGVDGFTHAGAGRLTFNTAVNTITATQGMLALGAGGSVNRLALGVNAGAGFDLNGHDATLTYLNGGGTIALGANTLTVNQTGISTPTEFGGFLFTPDDTTYSGVISGAGRLVKQGTGYLELTGDNTFSGGIEVASGPLVLNGSTNPAGGYLVQSGATLYAHAASNFGAAPATLRPDLITINGGRLEALAPVVLSATQGITISNGPSALAGALTINGPITGTGMLLVDGGRVLFNGTPYTGGLTYVQSGTLAIGHLNAVNRANTRFGYGSTFDVNGNSIDATNWPEAITLDGATLANGSATPVTVSHAIETDSWIGLAGSGGTLTFTGTLTGTVPAVGVNSSGNVVLNTPSASRIDSISVSSGNLSVPAASLTALDSVSLGGGRLQLTGAARDFAFGSFSMGSGTFFNDTDGPMAVTAVLQLTGAASLGGNSDLTLAGTVAGTANITKVGSGTLTVTSGLGGWTSMDAIYQPRFDVQEGTLAMSAAAYSVPGTIDNVPRPLTIGANGTVVLTDSSELVIRFLSGGGTLDLGANDLEVRQRNNGEAGDGVFTGNVTTTGNVVHNDPNGATFGTANGDKQSYGTLTVNSLMVNVGDVTVLNGLHVNSITVKDKLTTTTNGISTNGGTVLTGNFTSVQGPLKFTDGAIAGNGGNLTVEGGSAAVLGSTGAPIQFASNSGNLTARFGAALYVASNFTNTGNLSIYGGSYIDTANVLNQADGLFSVDNFTLVADKLNVSGGTAHFGPNSFFTRTGSGGNAVTNPGIVMTGGVLQGSSTFSGGIAMNGGTLSPGEGIGRLRVTNGAVFGPGGTYLWEIDDATGESMVNFDLLEITGSAANGRITVNSTAANPFTIAVVSGTGGMVVNFDSSQNYAWTLATTTGGFGTTFAADKFAVDISGFQTPTAGNFGVTTSGNNLELVYNWSHVYDNDSDMTVSSNLAANGLFGGLTKTGTGFLLLTGDNQYTGDTKIFEGTVKVGSGHALGESEVTVYGGTLVIEEGFDPDNKVILAGGKFERTMSGDLAHAVDATSKIGGLDITASILAGESAAPTTLVTSFKDNSIALNDEIRIGDIYELHGTGSNAFVLQLSFEGTNINRAIGWLDPSNLWVYAVDGNTGNNASSLQWGFVGSFPAFQAIYGNDLSSYMGAWGVEVNGGVTSTWAVLNHNSDFGVIPEPSTYGLIVLGLGLGLLGRLRKKA